MDSETREISLLKKQIRAEAGKFIWCPIELNYREKIVREKIVSGGLIRHVTNLISLLHRGR